MVQPGGSGTEPVQRWEFQLKQAKVGCAPLPARLELADRASALDAPSKERWRRQLKAYVHSGCQSSQGVSGRAFLELLTHLMLELEAPAPADVSELLEIYESLGSDAAAVNGALTSVALQGRWPEAAKLAELLCTNPAPGTHNPLFAEYMRALGSLRRRMGDGVVRGSPAFELRGAQPASRIQTTGLGAGFVVDQTRLGSLVGACPPHLSQRDALLRAIDPILRSPMLVDHGQRLRTYVGVSPSDPTRLYAIDVEGARVVAATPLPANVASSKGPTVGERFKSAFGAFVQGIAEVPAGLSQSIAVAASWLDEAGPTWMSSGLSTKELATYRFGDWIRTTARTYFPTNPDLQDNFVGHMLPSALGNLAGFAAGGWVSGVARASGAAFVTVAGSGMGGASHYNEATNKGVDDETARRAFGLGLLVGSTEAIPFSRLLKRIDTATGGGAMKTLQRHGLSALEEFVQEWTQTVSGNAVAQAFYDEHRTLFAGGLEAGASGGAAAAIFHGLVAGAVRVRTRGRPAAAAEVPTTASPEGNSWAGEDAPDPGSAAWFTPSPYTFGASQQLSYWVQLQRTLDEARLPSTSTTQRLGLIRRVAEGMNVPHLAHLSNDTDYTSAVNEVQLRVADVKEMDGNCKNAAVVMIKVLGEGGVATPLQSEYTLKGPHYSPKDDFKSKGAAEVTLNAVSQHQSVSDFFNRQLDEGQLGYLRTGNSKVGHATAVIKLDGVVYSINNQNWYKRLRVPPDRLQTLDEFLADWEGWSRDPSRYGDKYASSNEFEYEGFTTTYRLPKQGAPETASASAVPSVQLPQDWRTSLDTVTAWSAGKLGLEVGPFGSVRASRSGRPATVTVMLDRGPYPDPLSVRSVPQRGPQGEDLYQIYVHPKLSHTTQELADALVEQLRPFARN